MIIKLQLCLQNLSPGLHTGFTGQQFDNFGKINRINYMKKPSSLFLFVGMAFWIGFSLQAIVAEVWINSIRKSLALV
jgi:hypothetical protein